jgi:hypothetical protein
MFKGKRKENNMVLNYIKHIDKDPDDIFGLTDCVEFLTQILGEIDTGTRVMIHHHEVIDEYSSEQVNDIIDTLQQFIDGTITIQ